MQSRWMSFLETVTNIVVGYGLAVLTQIIVFPLFGLHVSLSENLLPCGGDHCQKHHSPTRRAPTMYIR